MNTNPGGVPTQNCHLANHIETLNQPKQKASRPFVACVVTNFPAEVVEKFACRFIQRTQCLHCNWLEVILGP